jgi:hypothetical protein
MSTRDFRGREIIIKVSDKAEVVGGAREGRRGMLPPGKKKKGPTRRRVGGDINFHDFGYIRADGDAAFQTLDIAVVPIFDSVLFGVPPLELSDYAGRSAVVLAIPENQWKARYSRIAAGSHSERLAIDINIEGDVIPIDDFPGWTSAGLKLSAEQSEGFVSVSSPYLEPVVLSPSAGAGFKFTAVPSFASPAVDFQIAARMDVFLMPRFSFSFARTTGADGIVVVGPSSAETFKGGYLNYFYAAWPRSFLLDPLNPNFEVPTSGVWSGGAGYPETAAAASVAKDLPYSRSYVNIYNELTGESFGSGPFPPSPFFLGSTPPPTSGNPRGTFLEVGAAPEAVLSGALVAVIISGTQKYYVWKED